MNYRHLFHAGNFADVFKHILLIALLQHLQRKDSGFCYLESHAGIGCYDLHSLEAQKSKEFVEGIQKISAQPNPPVLVQNYLDCIKKTNPDNALRYYPGSPYLARQFLRPQDRMVLAELHAEDYQSLKNFFRRDRQVAVHHQDGYQNLKAFLPPKERRGLVLIDPPYEQSNELIRLPAILHSIIQRWATGIYALWYPIKSLASQEQFYAQIEKHWPAVFLKVELYIYPNEAVTGQGSALDNRLNGCGMLIINPPWQFEQVLKEIMPWLGQHLRQGMWTGPTFSYQMLNA